MRHQRQWQDYTATVLWMIGKSLGGENWKLEPYIEFAYPEHKKRDNRTAEEIKADILMRLKQ